MHKIAVVGVGGIGRRHAQSLIGGLTITDKFYAVDPSKVSRDLLKDQLTASDLDKVIFLESAKDLPSEIDFLVIACSSKNRLQVLLDVLSRSTVKNLILEKVLFPTIDEYWQAAALIKEVKNGVYVNHPRRLYPVNSALKKLLVDEEFEFHVRGGEWGLLCNALHFIDLCQFLSGESPLSISTFQLNKVFDSKRAGYSEAFGIVSGICGKAKFVLESVEDWHKPMEMSISAKDFKLTIEESTGLIRLDAHDQEKYKILEAVKISLYQSELTDMVSKDILSGHNVDLPSYSLSATSHIIFLAALQNALSEIKITYSDICIT